MGHQGLSGPAAKRAGVPWASPHTLRRGVATLMAERGYEAHDIAWMLRHADGRALAQRTYMHPRVRNVDFLDDLLGAKERKERDPAYCASSPTSRRHDPNG